MFKKKKELGKNYYTAPFPKRYFEKAQLRNAVLILVALAFMLPAVITLFFAEYKCLIWLADSHAGQFFFLLLEALSVIALVYCAIATFNRYKSRERVLQKDAPALGFGRMTYAGILAMTIIVTLFASFLALLFFFYVLADSFGIFGIELAEIRAASPSQGDIAVGFDTTGLIALVLTQISEIAACAYYRSVFVANRSMTIVYVADNENN